MIMAPGPLRAFLVKCELPGPPEPELSRVRAARAGESRIKSEPRSRPSHGPSRRARADSKAPSPSQAAAAALSY